MREELLQERKKAIYGLICDDLYVPMKAKEIAAVLNVPKSDRRDLAEVLDALVAEGKVEVSSKGKYMKSEGRFLTGVFTAHPRGFGFVTVEGEDEDIFIPESQVNGAFHGDTVQVALTRAEGHGRRREGQITKILTRGVSRIVCTYEKSKTFGFAVPDNPRFGQDIFIPQECAKGAVSGHKVVVELTDFGGNGKKPEGKVVEILGHVNDPGTDILSIVRGYDLPTEFPGAQILGFHLEGPYISPKHKGAQNEKFIRKPDINEFRRFKRVKMMTLAPETEGAYEFISAVTPECVIALGHTDCGYETALRAIGCGANCLTHTYNAMPPFHHRNPGPIGAAFERNIYAQLICDGFHISKPVVLATYKMFGPERMTIISDSIRCAGLPDGRYESGGLDVILKDGAARLPDGTIAGSCAMLWDCVKKAVEFGIPFEDAVRMASRTPAELLGVKKGVIDCGYDADMLIIDEKMNITAVIIAGEIYCRP